MFENKYPYTDFHELNLDWILETVKEDKETIDEIHDNIQGYITAWIKAHLNDIMVAATYDETSETITLESALISIDGIHEYSPSDNTMIIE